MKKMEDGQASLPEAQREVVRAEEPTELQQTIRQPNRRTINRSNRRKETPQPQQGPHGANERQANKLFFEFF